MYANCEIFLDCLTCEEFKNLGGNTKDLPAYHVTDGVRYRRTCNGRSETTQSQDCGRLTGYFRGAGWQVCDSYGYVIEGKYTKYGCDLL